MPTVWLALLALFLLSGAPYTSDASCVPLPEDGDCLSLCPEDCLDECIHECIDNDPLEGVPLPSDEEDEFLDDQDDQCWPILGEDEAFT